MFKLGQPVLTLGSQIAIRVTSIFGTFVAISLLVLLAIGLDAVSSPAHADPDLDVQTQNATAIANGDLIGDISVTKGTDFGSVIITKGATNTFVVVNRGTSDLTFQNPAVIVDDPTNFSASSTSFNGQTMVPNTSRTFTLTFHPQVAGASSTTVTLRSNDPNDDPYTFVISGTGLDVPEINVSSSDTGNLSDGGTDTHLSANAGSSKTVTYTIQNTGSQALNLTNSAPTLTNAVNVGTPVVSKYSVTTLPNSATTATFTVTYTPQLAGAFRFDLDIISDDPDEATFDIAASGTATGVPEINIQGNGQNISLGDTTPSTSDHTDFGDVSVGSAEQRTFTIQNTGKAALNISEITTDGGDFSISSAPSSIAAGSSGTFKVDLTASVAGSRFGIITVKSDDSDESNYSFDVIANAITPEISLSSTENISITDGGTESYGTEGIGVANTVTYTISNTGSAPLTLTGSAPTLSNPSNVGTPTVGNYSTTTVAANGGQASFTVTYTPDAAGAFSFDLLIVSDDLDESNFDFTASGTAADLTRPFLLSVARHSPTTETTSADRLTWRITFNEDIVGLDATDVDIDGTTASVESLTAVSGSVYDLTISGGDLSTVNGEVESSFGASAATITDLAGNLLQLSDPTGVDENTYQLVNETIPPRLVSIDRANPTTQTTGEDTLTWRVIFNEDVTGVDTSDFTVGGTTATVTNVAAASATTYDVTVSGGDLANLVGTVSLSPIAGVTNIEDISGNGFVDATPTGTNNNSYNVFNDVVGPALTSIARQSPIFDTTDADSLTWRFTFDEDAVNFDTADVTVSGTTATVSNISAVSSSVYDVTITGGDLANLNAIVQISLSSSLTIQDTLGNNAIATVPTTNQNFFTLVNDVAPPRVASITRHNPLTETTQEDTLIWQFTFDEAVTGVDASDFTVSVTTGAVADVETVSTTVYNVKVAGGDLATVAATVSIDVNDKGTNIADAKGNVLNNATPTGTNENSYNVELPISSTTVEVVSDEGKSVADGGSDEKPDEPAGTPITNTYTFTNTSSSPITISGAPVISGSNNAGSPTVSNFSAPTTKPVKKVNLTIPQRKFAYAGAVTMDVLEAISNSIITPAHASSITLDPGESTSFDVTFTPESEGEFSVEVDIVSSVGTFDIEVSGSAVDTTKPSVSINGAPSAHDGSTPFSVTFEFSENVGGFDIGDITVGNGTASNFVAVDRNTYTANITPGSAANTTIDVASAIATDGAGNTNTAATQVLVSGGTAVKETLTAISNFMMNRANHMLSNQPDMIGFVSGSNNSGGGPLGNLQLESDLDSETTMSFFTSRSKILQAREGGFGKGNRPTVENEIPLFASAERFSDDPQTTSNLLVKKEEDHEPEPQGFNTNNRTGFWDVWTQIKGSKSTQTNLKSEFWSAYFGTHYFISNDVLFGVLTQIDWAEEINSATGSTVSGNGFMIGPYIAGKLKDQNLYFEARTLWGQSSNDVTPIGTYTDSFETERWLASLKIQGSYDLNDEISIKPEVSISYFKETQEAYTDSNSDLIPEQTISLGEFKFGPTITRKFDMGNGYTMRATTGLSGITNFSVKNANSSTSNAFADENLRARVDAKIELENEYGVRFTAAGYYDGIGASDFQSYGGTLGLTIPIY